MESDYHDPFSESGHRGLEQLMALGVLTEAGSRLAAEHARTRAAREERQLDRERVVHAADADAQRLALTEESRRFRELRKFAGEPTRLREHLRILPVQEVARHWRWGAGRSEGDAVATAVLAASEAELRRRWPALMNAYDQARQDGVSPHRAMSAAARHAFFGGARPHGATVHAPGGALPALDAELDREFRRRADGLDPVTRQRWLRALEDRGWSPASLSWAEALLQRADALRREAAVSVGDLNGQDATTVDRAEGLDDAAAATARADDHEADAAAVAGATGQRTTPRPETSAVGKARPAVKLARLSFASPAAAALRQVARPAPTVAPDPQRTSRKRQVR